MLCMLTTALQADLVPHTCTVTGGSGHLLLKRPASGVAYTQQQWAYQSSRLRSMPGRKHHHQRYQTHLLLLWLLRGEFCTPIHHLHRLKMVVACC